MIEGYAFKPAEVRIPVGSIVTWYNRDEVAHTATARDRTFDSGWLSRGGRFSYKFEKKGTFEYYCIPHPYMVGKVIVE
ncbi:MAG: cupredoxin family copper-binding protein [Dehalococcoidia bacterium]|nr:cupredoxin family copper-binding protein [Dehalococcoidia bacterium]